MNCGELTIPRPRLHRLRRPMPAMHIPMLIQLTPINGGLLLCNIRSNRRWTIALRAEILVHGWHAPTEITGEFSSRHESRKMHISRCIRRPKSSRLPAVYALFSMYSSLNGATNATQLWRIDPSTGATTQLGKGFGDITFLGQITEANPHVFAAYDESNPLPYQSAIRVWITDGTPAGTKPLNRFYYGSYDNNAITGLAFDGKVYLSA